jgi:phospholipid/cholesterol/gamma-HCH transport system substrate-binding protein
MTAEASWIKIRRRSVGVVFLVVLALLVWLSIAIYNKQFTPVVSVLLETDSAGNEMHPHAEVKVRGVVVGEVRQISSTGDGARLELAIQPDMVNRPSCCRRRCSVNGTSTWSCRPIRTLSGSPPAA